MKYCKQQLSGDVMLCIDFTEYSIESGNDGHVFAVNITTGSLYVVGELSYDRQKVYASYCSLNVHNVLDDYVLTQVEFKYILTEAGNDRTASAVIFTKVNVI